MLVFYFILLLAVKTIFTHEIVFDRIEGAFGDDDKVDSFDGLRVKKFNRTLYVLNGKFTLKQEIDDRFSVHVAGFNLQGGQYKKMGEKRVDKVCETLYDGDKYKDMYDDIQSTIDKKVPFKTCPYPAGTYEITNLFLEDKGRLPAYIPGGEKWRMDVRALIGDEILGGYNFYGSLKNEKNLLNG